LIDWGSIDDREHHVCIVTEKELLESKEPFEVDSCFVLGITPDENNEYGMPYKNHLKERDKLCPQVRESNISGREKD